MPNATPDNRDPGPDFEFVTGVQLMQGIGVQPAQGFWADAWSQVVRRPRAVLALCWVGLVALLAAFGPFLANGHPLRLVERAGTVVVGTRSPLFENLKAGDVVGATGVIAGLAWMFLARRRVKRSTRLGSLVVWGLQAAVVLVAIAAVLALMRGSENAEVRRLATSSWAFRAGLAALIGAAAAAAGAWMSPLAGARPRWAGAVAVSALAATSGAVWHRQPLQVFDYRSAIDAGRATAVYTIIPFSPYERRVGHDLLHPGQSADQSRLDAGQKPPTPGQHRHVLGTDSFGQDVASQMIHACRLAISIGLVSTSISVLIGVTLGAIMGYFGGWVDLLLFRVVEVFMAIPVLVLLIVAAAVLPRNVYAMMVVIGAVTWTGAARFTRAEFLKLRNQDFVQAARAVGLPLKSILFRHMLTNGVTPVLVDASFAVAAAILAEVTLSFLGLGPEEQASWGRLLAEATNTVGDFVWWLAIFPGLAIFLTVLSYNVIGECLRDAIDPRLKKARV